MEPFCASCKLNRKWLNISRWFFFSWSKFEFFFFVFCITFKIIYLFSANRLRNFTNEIYSVIFFLINVDCLFVSFLFYFVKRFNFLLYTYVYVETKYIVAKCNLYLVVIIIAVYCRPPKMHGFLICIFQFH